MSDLPHGALLETWGDSTCWIILPTGSRLTLRDYLESANLPDARYT